MIVEGWIPSTYNHDKVGGGSWLGVFCFFFTGFPRHTQQEVAVAVEHEPFLGGLFGLMVGLLYLPSLKR